MDFIVDINCGAKQYSSPTNQRGNHGNQTCNNCLLVHYAGTQCPARNSHCYHCKKTGHYSRACRMKRQKNIHELETYSDDQQYEELSERFDDQTCVGEISATQHDTLFLGSIETTQINQPQNSVHTVQSTACKKKSLLSMNLSAGIDTTKHSVICKIDSGAETDIIPISVFNRIFPNGYNLSKPTVKLKAYGGAIIRNLGSCRTYAQVPGRDNQEQIVVEVADVDGPVIIGNETAQELGLLKVTFPISTESTVSTHKKQTNTSCDSQTTKLHDVNGKQHPFPLTKDYLLIEYKDVFTGIGCFPGEPYHIELDTTVQPVQHAARQVPIHRQQQYKEQLADLVERDILCKVNNEYTPWVNSTVLTTRSNGSIRMCLDPRDLNKALKHNPYYVRTVDDVMPKVSGASHFSIIDARNGFWQVELDNESSKLCTFSTPWGKYRWKRLPFGLSVNGDIFKEKMDSVFGHLDGLTGIADDTFIFGKDELLHDQHVLNALDTARANNVRLNRDKFQFKTDEASFFGLKWTAEGIKPEEKKIQAITNMPKPTNLTETQSFMGMINYLNIFSPAIAEASEPIRQLMKKDTPDRTREILSRPETDNHRVTSTKLL